MQNRTILLVEDNITDELLVLRALEKSGIAHGIIVIKDGAEALDYLLNGESHGNCNTDELPTVVFLDIKLPKVSGFEVLQRLRSEQRTRFLPVVILTSSDDENDIFTGYALGANSYVHKPVTSTEFSETVAHLALYWLTINKEPITRT